MRHLLSMADLTAAEIERIFAISEDLKAKFSQGLREPLLPGRVLALLFEKPSLRTRVSFEAGMAHLGGSSLFLGDGSRLRPPRVDRRFRPRAQRIRRCHRGPRQTHQTVPTVGRALHLLGDQRLDRLLASLPGDGRPVHPPRAVRQARRPHGGLGGRRQQRCPQPGHGLRQAGHPVGDGHAQELSLRAADTPHLCRDVPSWSWR